MVKLLVYLGFMLIGFGFFYITRMIKDLKKIETKENEHTSFSSRNGPGEWNQNQSKGLERFEKENDKNQYIEETVRTKRPEPRIFEQQYVGGYTKDPLINTDEFEEFESGYIGSGSTDFGLNNKIEFENEHIGEHETASNFNDGIDFSAFENEYIGINTIDSDVNESTSFENIGIKSVDENLEKPINKVLPEPLIDEKVNVSNYTEKLNEYSFSETNGFEDEGERLLAEEEELLRRPRTEEPIQKEYDFNELYKEILGEEVIDNDVDDKNKKENDTVDTVDTADIGEIDAWVQGRLNHNQVEEIENTINDKKEIKDEFIEESNISTKKPYIPTPAYNYEKNESLVEVTETDSTVSNEVEVAVEVADKEEEDLFESFINGSAKLTIPKAKDYMDIEEEETHEEIKEDSHIEIEQALDEEVELDIKNIFNEDNNTNKGLVEKVNTKSNQQESVLMDDEIEILRPNENTKVNKLQEDERVPKIKNNPNDFMDEEITLGISKNTKVEEEFGFDLNNKVSSSEPRKTEIASDKTKRQPILNDSLAEEEINFKFSIPKMETIKKEENKNKKVQENKNLDEDSIEQRLERLSRLMDEAENKK